MNTCIFLYDCAILWQVTTNNKGGKNKWNDVKCISIKKCWFIFSIPSLHSCIIVLYSLCLKCHTLVPYSLLIAQGNELNGIFWNSVIKWPRTRLTSALVNCYNVLFFKKMIDNTIFSRVICWCTTVTLKINVISSFLLATTKDDAAFLGRFSHVTFHSPFWDAISTLNRATTSSSFLPTALRNRIHQG